MIAFPAGIELDRELLERQYRFVLSRARHHEGVHEEQGETQRSSQWSVARACAATLYRDAAAIALLTDSAEAALYLKRAGTLLLADGSLAGLCFLALAERLGESVSEKIDGVEADAVISLDFLQSAGSHDFEQIERVERPFDDAVQMPRQLFELYRALAVRRRRENRTRRNLREMLRAYSVPDKFGSGISYNEYATMLDEFEEQPGRERFSESTEALLSTALLTRRAGLIVAHADTHRWNRVVNSTAIVDFELLLLALIAIDRGNASAMEAAWGGTDDLLRRPLRLAIELSDRPNFR